MTSSPDPRSLRDLPEAHDALAHIRELHRSTTPLVVAIDGRSGTGKSTIAAWLAAHLGALHIDQDDFYAGGALDAWRPLDPAAKADRVIDWRRVRREALEPLRAGRTARWHPFDWETMEGLAAETITAEPAGIILLDGAYAARPELADLVDLAILVTLPDAVRLPRLRAREGDDYVADWQAIWDEAEAYYFETVRPPDAFDLVIARR